MCIRYYVKPYVPLEQIPEYSWSILKKQCSFNFSYNISKKSIQLEIALKGTFNTPDVFEIKGTWIQGDKKENIQMIGIGDVEFEKENTKWKVHPRGEETQIIEMVEKVIGNILHRKRKRVKFVDSVEKSLIFEFKPNLAFLDPVFSKKFKGLLYINKRNYMIDSIVCNSTDHDIYFFFSVKNINKAKKIKIPFIIKNEVVFRSKNSKKAEKIIKKRLKEAGIKAKIKRKGEKIVVLGDATLTQPKVNILALSGTPLILLLSIKGKGEKISLKNHPSDIFYIKDTLLHNSVKKAEVVMDDLSRPGVKVEFKKEIPPTGTDYAGFFMDGILYQVYKFDKKTNCFIIKNITTYNEAELLKNILNNPMKEKLTIEEVRRK